MSWGLIWSQGAAGKIDFLQHNLNPDILEVRPHRHTPVRTIPLGREGEREAQQPNGK